MSNQVKSKPITREEAASMSMLALKSPKEWASFIGFLSRQSDYANSQYHTCRDRHEYHQGYVNAWTEIKNIEKYKEKFFNK